MKKKRMTLIVISFSWVLLIHLTLALSSNSIEICNQVGTYRLNLVESLIANGLTIVYLIALVSLLILLFAEVKSRYQNNKQKA